MDSQVALQYLAEAPVRPLLDAGLEPLRIRLEAALAADSTLADIGIAVAAVRLTNLAPSSELERALQTPTFEALQQKADPDRGGRHHCGCGGGSVPRRGRRPGHSG